MRETEQKKNESLTKLSLTPSSNIATNILMNTTDIHTAILALLEGGTWYSEALLEEKMKALGFISDDIFAAVGNLVSEDWLQCDKYLVRMPYRREVTDNRPLYRRPNGGGYTFEPVGTPVPVIAPGA